MLRVKSKVLLPPFGSKQCRDVARYTHSIYCTEPPGTCQGVSVTVEKDEGQKIPQLVQDCSMHNQMSYTPRRYFSTSSRRLTVRVDPKKDYYRTLGVTKSCTQIKVKEAFYRLSKVYHPDVNQSNEAVQKFHDITEAYEVLSNRRLRQQYEDSVHIHHPGHFTDGVYRGTKVTHPRNFSSKGPIQTGKTAHYDYDTWVKNHYSDAFEEQKRRRIDMNMNNQRPPPKENTKPLGFEITNNNYMVAAAFLLSFAVLMKIIGPK